ncbi:AGE family epimerase/isomerase [Mariniblastus fucicola]|uniref:Cellobiose 2-epimerase n=1 Tax=Mariniblastus fucicola TaxID=980251 RepID=A0A5B9P7T0_9BACT|nr:AGE family epimerase/isomerase [Mariniblastus fucicola]QEG21569.1 Cellobiose 2-epimerase [Mariniblastus fucicola]
MYHVAIPRSSLAIFLLIAVLTTSGRAQDTANGDLTALADQCDAHLRKSIVDFYLPHCVDEKNGGYLETIDAEGKFCESEYKFLTLQTRQMWFFCQLVKNDIEKEKALAAAKSGFDFLQTHFLDKENGGYFSRVTMDGGEFDTRKHIYLNAFAMYGLAAYYNATGDGEALAAALNLFEKFEQKAYDKQNGGYREFFYADWTEITDPNEPKFVGEVGTKTYNSHLHILEAFTELFRAAPSDRLKERIAELIVINTSTVRHPQHPCNIDRWTNDWQMVKEDFNLRASYGHDVECAWLVFDAAREIGWSIKPLQNWAVATVDHSIKFGFDAEHGGFYYSGPLGEASDDTKKEWWTQAEALVSMLEMYRLTGDEKYMDVFHKTFAFVEQYQIASAENGGGWWASRHADGSTHANTSRTSTWHGAYHNGRAMILCGELLREMAVKQE